MFFIRHAQACWFSYLNVRTERGLLKLGYEMPMMKPCSEHNIIGDGRKRDERKKGRFGYSSSSVSRNPCCTRWTRLESIPWFHPVADRRWKQSPRVESVLRRSWRARGVEMGFTRPVMRTTLSAGPVPKDASSVVARVPAHPAASSKVLGARWYCDAWGRCRRGLTLPPPGV